MVERFLPDGMRYVVKQSKFCLRGKKNAYGFWVLGFLPFLTVAFYTAILLMEKFVREVRLVVEQHTKDP